MPRTHTTPEETQRFHGERVEARQRERAHVALGRGPLDHHVSLDENPAEFFARLSKLPNHEADDVLVKAGVLPPKGHPKEAELLTAILLDMFAFTALIGDAFDNVNALVGDETGGHPALDNAPKTAFGERFPSTAELEASFHADADHHDNGEPIKSPEPPFMIFWEKLNKKLVAAGKPEVGYGAAKLAFDGGETPDGALTFIGKEWDGLRAIPAPLVNDKLAYNGEFREVSDEYGTVWRTVHNQYGAIAYTTAEYALKGAKLARQHSEDNG